MPSFKRQVIFFNRKISIEHSAVVETAISTHPKGIKTVLYHHPMPYVQYICQGLFHILRLFDNLPRHVLRHQREHQRAGARDLNLMLDVFRIIRKLKAEESGDLV